MHIPETLTRAQRHDGWTPERQMRFLDCLAMRGNVRLACREAGMSPEAAYRLKGRDPQFARGWAAALVLAHDFSVEVLADRAIDGVEEPIYYRGELVGTRRKYDSRPLLAHVARLDKAVENGTAKADAARFDELLACIAGERPPEDFAVEHDALPLSSAEAGVAMAEAAEEAAREAGEGEDGAFTAAYNLGREAGGALWDSWRENACSYVDWLCGRLDDGAPGRGGEPPSAPVEGAPESADGPCGSAGQSFPWTPSESSTSRPAGEGAGMA
jgi:hypothetical protein